MKGRKLAHLSCPAKAGATKKGSTPRKKNLLLRSKFFPLRDESIDKGVLICFEVLRPSQPNGVMPSAVSLPNHTFIGQA